MRLINRIRGDLVYLLGAIRTLRATTPIARNPTRVLPHLIDALAARFGDEPALVSERERFTYRELAGRANRYARWALAQRLRKGEVVCLMMPNRPEYVAVWLGVTAVGGVAALLNTNLGGPALACCIDIVAPQHVIVAAELLPALTGAEPFLQSRPQIWTHGDGRGQFPHIDRAIEALDPAPLSEVERPRLTIEDKALYIYTSGTTGMPKAANINHYRLMLASYGFAGVMDTRASDRMYDCLPMYHTAGGIAAIGALLVVGGSVVIREKFSARDFWPDVVRNECTLFQYIGELCRYLVNAPPQPGEKKHRLRLCCGNGLRPDIWAAFTTRFAIPTIVEFYAATEGNVMLFNFEGQAGAVGRIPWFLAGKLPIRIVQFDVESGTPVRDARGFCIACPTGEAGEAIGRIINDPARPASRFEGYADESDNERKILRDVFERGDAWFRTGDLMRKDADGFFYFVDRIGDTFRWKGENVSTTQVCEAVATFTGITDATVYGIAVPGHEGHAGMAAVACAGDLDIAALRAHLARQLPAYACPLFLRIRREIELTATFKQKKIDLIAQGFDPSRIRDPLYFNDPGEGAFVPLDAALYARILAHEVRL